MVIASYFQKVLQKKNGVCVWNRKKQRVNLSRWNVRGVHSIDFFKMEIAQNKNLGKILLRKANFGGGESTYKPIVLLHGTD